MNNDIYNHMAPTRSTPFNVNVHVPRRSTLQKFEKNFLQDQTTSGGKIVDPFSLYQVPKPSPAFHSLTPPSTKLLSFTLRYITAALRALKGIHSSEWYPDFGDGEIAESVFVYGDLRALKGVVGFLHQGGIGEKYCWLLEGMDGRLYCVEDEDPERAFDLGHAQGREGARKIVDEVFGWL